MKNEQSPHLHVLELACPALPVVRIGLVGAGHRGLKALRRYADIEGAVFNAVADLDPARLDEANQQLRTTDVPWPTSCRAKRHGGCCAGATMSTSSTFARSGTLMWT